MLYADDKKIYARINTILDCVYLQEDLHRLESYYINNRININVLKCSSITFSRRRSPLVYSYSINNIAITRVNFVKDLGVFLDQKLAFSDHISFITDRAYKNLGFVMRVSSNFTDPGCILALYNSYVRSLLEYCSVIWNPQYTVYINCIERLQKKFISFMNYRCNILCSDYADACDRYNILTLESRRYLLDMLFLYDICSGCIDSSALTTRLINLSAPTRRTRHTKLFHAQGSRTFYARNAVIPRLQKTYNDKFSCVDPFCVSKRSFKKEIIECIKCSTKNS